MKENLIFVKCSDVDEMYPFLFVYAKNVDTINAFMEISLDDQKKIQYILDFEYFHHGISLSSEEWLLIQHKAELLLSEVIENEKYYR